MKDSWQARWIGWRNRMLADEGFQRFASRTPLLRGVARRRARALFDLVAGFAYSQTVAACIEADLLALLKPAPLMLSDIAARTLLPTEGAERLLKAAAALGLTEPLGNGRWALGADGAALLGNRGITAMVGHHRALYADLADPVQLLRRGGGGGELSRYWQYAEEPGAGDAVTVARYSQLMAASQPLVAGQVLDAYRFGRHHSLLDVGGGEGAFVSAVAAREPRLALAVYDLPAVAARARDALASAGLCDRIHVHEGDFLRDPLPKGHDLITMVRVLHDHDDKPAMALLRNVRAALPSGGRLLIAEPMSGTRGAESAGDAYFGLYLLAMGSGRPRTPNEIRAMLRAAGFATSRTLRTAIPLTACAIVASA